MTPGGLALYWGGFFLIFLLPGIFLSQSIGILRRRVSAGERLLPAFLLSAGVLGVVYGASLTLRLPLHVALGLELGLTAMAALAALLAGRADTGRLPEPRLEAPEGAWSTRLLLALLGVVFLLMLREGGSLGPVHDSLDFVAFVQRMLLTDRVDLAVAAYPDTGDLAPDPRRGAFHLGAALLCRLSGAHPTDMWRALPTLLVPLALWVFFVTTRRVMRSAAIAFWATLAFVVATLFDRDRFLQNLGYASRIGWVYSWVALWALALWLDANRADETPPPDWRPFHPPRRRRALLALALLTAPILVGVHILSALQSLLALGALAWTWALALPEPPPIKRTLIALPLVGAVLLLPLVLLQVGRTYSSANPLFDHPQGLLLLAPPWAVLGPTVLARWFGWPGLIGVVAACLAARHARWDRGAAFLLGSTLVTAAIVLNPLAVLLVEKAKAHSVLFRVLYVAPIYPALGWLLVWSWSRARGPRRILAAALGGAILLAYAAQVKGALQFWGEAAYRRAAFEESRPLLAALAFLDEADPQPSTVASDPISSYQIPAYSRHYAMCPYNQHSSPADARAIERTYDARAIQNPLVSMGDTWRRIEAYDVRYVLLNHSYPRYFRSYLTFISPLTFEAERGKFERAPDRFERIYDRAGIVIYRVHREAGPPRVESGSASGGEDSLSTAHAYRALSAEAAHGRTLAELASELHVGEPHVPAVEGLELIGLDWKSVAGDSLPRFRRGGYVRTQSYWRQTAPVGLPVEAFLRAETTTDDPRLQDPLLGRLYRRWFESRSGQVLRFGRLHQPLETWYPPFLWEKDAVYRDDFWLPIPEHARPGRYQLRLQLAVTPYTPNMELRDLFSLRDSFDGPVVGEIEIVE